MSDAKACDIQRARSNLTISVRPVRSLVRSELLNFEINDSFPALSVAIEKVLYTKEFRRYRIRSLGSVLDSNEMEEVPPLVFREPRLADAAAITRLVRRCPPLDVNSHYVSLLLCRDFHATCVVADCDSAVVGFLSAYRPPPRHDTVFVWQVAVDGQLRSRGVASRMLEALLRRNACSDVNYLEATVTPSNTSSQSLFRSLAKRLNTECRTSCGFSAELFSGPEEHEPEELYRIGPFTLNHACEEGSHIS